MSDLRDLVDTQVQRWVRTDIQKLAAYPVPDATGLIKLDAMENPYTWPDALRHEWADWLGRTDVNRYPHPDAPKVKAGLREVMNIGEEWDILLGNGSDELIQLIAMALAGTGRTILAPEPSFVMYRMIAQYLDMDYVGVPLTANFELDLETMLAKIEREQPALVFLAQPNNPTGNLWGDEKLRRIIEAAPGLVVLDEAYTAFTQADYLGWLEDYPNLLIMRTLSKVGLAGLRLGILIGHPSWIEQVNKLRLPYNINSLTQLTATFALEHFEVFEQQTRELVTLRSDLYQALKALPGLTVFESEANFLLVRTEPGQAPVIHQALKDAGILIKKLDGAHPLLADCLRINVSSPEENSALVQALQGILG
ncbi:histidinol-phosphate transaminase [Saccharospirillum salsuginis]|uniref:Histidinol-phosphate aminotransferase n=1 Tax=Saccharospirillum salsuginis TaxID=418750 RepID=A0A918KR52_9GAMM|nr:histidinol-phosphate transaminase [Saccharospirillum salsuginis]GGX70331.1 histidinol-phosphate aminotransferase 1 [Saccharospirillum salsuginis]